MDQHGLNWTKLNKIWPNWIEMHQIGWIKPKWTGMDWNRPKRTKLDWNRPKWTKVGVYYPYLLKLMKMTCGYLSRSQIGPFNIALNTTLAYNYEYSGGIGFFSCEYKLNIK